MSEQLSADAVRAVARLARLHLEESEVDAFRPQLAGVLDHVASLESVDTDGVEPMAHPLDLVNRLAADEPGETMPTEHLLRNAPAVRGSYLDVPKVLGGGDSS